MELIEKYYMKNGSLEEVETFKDISFDHCDVIYEVIRIINGVPLFIEQHMERLKTSAALLHTTLADDYLEQILQGIMSLIKANNYPLKNIKLLVTIKNNELNYFIYFIQSTYPSLEMYSNGVSATFAHMERSNPKVKQVNLIFKQKIAALLETKDAFEAILVNNDGYITEGSRSNIFILKGRSAITPLSKDILSGVSRESIIQVCRDMHIPIEEKLLSVEDVLSADAVFMCGTSPKILPFSSIDGHSLPSCDSHLMYSIMIEYSKYIDDYIDKYKK